MKQSKGQLRLRAKMDRHKDFAEMWPNLFQYVDCGINSFCTHNHATDKAGTQSLCLVSQEQATHVKISENSLVHVKVSASILVVLNNLNLPGDTVLINMMCVALILVNGMCTINSFYSSHKA